MESRESIDLDLSRYLLAWKRRCLPAACVFAITGILAAVATTAVGKIPSYQAQGKLLFQTDRSSYLTRVGEGEETKELIPLVANQNPVSTQIEVVYSTPLLQKTIDALRLKNEKGQPLKPEDIKKKLSAKIIGGTDVLQLSYESRKVNLEKLANTLPLPIKFESRRKRIQRFLSLPNLQIDKIWFPIVTTWLSTYFTTGEVIYLAIDRTSWSTINLLMISVVWQKRAFPIYFELLS